MPGFPLRCSGYRAFLVAQMVKNLPAMQETRVQFLGQKECLEKEMATHSSFRIGYPKDWIQSLGWEDPLENGKAYPLQHSGLENSMDCIVHEVAKNQT